ncbi:MAG: histidine kinase [Acidobacteriota bacterium]
MNESLLVNTLGHLAGVLLFGIFLALLLQDRTARGLPRGRKSMWAATLALAWNFVSLVVLGTNDPDSLATRWMVAIGFSVLSLLPAVLFDLCLEERHRGLALAGYALAIAAIVPHVIELFRADTDLHRFALTSITVGFGALTAIAAFLAYRERGGPATSRLIGTMSLFLLAMSFVHLGSGHAEQIWSQELAFHHAAIPLALLVLLQDYRFVLLDAFLRFLANVLLAVGFVSAAAIALRLGWLPAADTPFHLALLLSGACLLLILFAIIRGLVQRLLTRVVFRRGDSHVLLSALRVPVRDEETYVQEAVQRLARYASASATIASAAPSDADAVLPLRVSSGKTRYIVFGRRTGGRRYLSEDLAVLHQASAVIAEQLDLHHESEMRRLVSQAELRALQSQIHPHFLFNALNALYGIIPREARGARETVLNLADIFRYFLETRKTMVPLSEELHIVRAYLDVEQLRLGDKLHTEIDVTPEAMNIAIPILSLQPLVENAVKHAIAPLAAGGAVTLRARVTEDHSLAVSIADTGRGFESTGRRGVGLENVERRLELCYGPGARLNIESTPQGSTVSLLIPATAPQAVEAAR